MSTKNDRYPKLKLEIRSKNELAKRISGKNLPFKKASKLINDVIKNHNKYWHDVEVFSEPKKNKYVRNAKGTPLGKLLSLIDKKVLAPHDNLVPDFIFGGVSDRSHIKASYYLLGRQRKRTKLGLDISKFFEQNDSEKVFNFLNKRCKCSKRASNILTKLCCVPLGPKDSGSNNMALARGFATSTRLSLWCNLSLFLRILWKVRRVLKNKDVRVAIFVDDIGITASRTPKETMNSLAQDIDKISNKFGLSLNPDKKSLQSYSDGHMEHLGIELGRNKLSMGRKTTKRRDKIKEKLKNDKLSKLEKDKLVSQKKAYIIYNRSIKKITEN